MAETPITPEAQPQKKKKAILVPLLIVLAVLCVGTGALMVSRLLTQSPSQTDGIDILNTNPSTEDADGSSDGSSDGSGDGSGNNSDDGSADSGEDPWKDVTNTFNPFPGFEIVDEKKKWSLDTDVEIFRVSYVNGNNEVVIQSDDGEKVIAPGASNTYTFKLKNTGNVAIQYDLFIDAYTTPAGTPIPLESKLQRFDGKWLVGGGNSYGDTAALNAAEDTFVLGAGRHSYYTLEWKWPFEGDDELDTLLGNSDGLSYTIVIRTVAVEDVNPDASGGIITPPDTSDTTDTVGWGLLLVGSLFLLILIPILRRRDEDEDAVEA